MGRIIAPKKQSADAEKVNSSFNSGKYISLRKNKKSMTEFVTFLGKAVIYVIGAIAGLLMPTVPFVLICVFAVFVDSISAWRLGKRIKKRHPEIPSDNIHDRYESERAWKMFPTLLVVYGCIVLGYLIDTIIFPFVDMYLSNMIAGGFCLYSLWSVLENESSENDEQWALFLQRFMVNKANRHIDGLKDAFDSIKK